MLNCVECGAPIVHAGEPCAACGAQADTGPINGTRQPRLEDPDGLVVGDSPLLRGDDDEPRRHEHPEQQTIVRTPLRNDPPLEIPAVAAAKPAVAEEAAPAHFVSRAIALLIDLAVLSFLDGVLFTLATSAVYVAEGITGARVGDAVSLVRDSVSAGSMTLLIGYFSVLHARSGQTLGKAAMRIEVADPDGGRISMVRSVLRTLSYALSALPFFAGFLLALGPAHRALHDRIADTVVLRQRSGS